MGADKFNWCLGRVVAKIVLAAFGFLLLAISGAAAQENAWSFEDNPHPTYEEMTSKEKLSLVVNSDSFVTNCQDLIRASFNVYQKRYAQFALAGDAKTNFSGWKFHIIIKQSDTELASCISFLSSFRLISLSDSLPDTSARPDFYFCGIFSRPPATKREREIVEVIDEFVGYANTGIDHTLIRVFSANKWEEIFDLNPDVEYYFRKLALPAFASNSEESDVSHLEPLISEERRAFVNRAAEKFDLQAVLDTTEPCAPRTAG